MDSNELKELYRRRERNKKNQSYEKRRVEELLKEVKHLYKEEIKKKRA